MKFIFFAIVFLQLSSCITLWISSFYYNSVDGAVDGWAEYRKLDLSNQNLKEILRDIVRLRGKNL